MATLYAHIKNGELLGVGPLPVRAVRYDTLEVVDPAHWLEACGRYEIESLRDNPGQVDATPEQKVAIRDGIIDALARLQRRQGADAKLVTAANFAKDVFWDWLDAYCDSSVVPLLDGASPNAGATWAGLTVGNKAEALRLGQSYASLWAIRTADALLLLGDVLREVIATTDVDPPD